MLKNKLVFILAIIMMVTVQLFALISLLYFNMHDNSFFFYSSMATITKNPLGFLGAYGASFLYYFFGSGAYLLLGVIVPITSLVGMKRFSVREFSTFFLLAIAGVFFLSILSWFKYAREGGRIGYVLVHTAYQLWGHEKGTMILWISFVASSLSFFYYVYAFYFSLFFTAFFKNNSSDNDEHNGKNNVVCHAQHDVVEEHKNERFVNTVELQGLEQMFEDIQKPENMPAYKVPSLAIFIEKNNNYTDKNIMMELKESALALREKLECFGIKGTVVEVRQGPVVTLFEYQPEIGSKISKIVALEDDLALALSAMSIRIIAPIPGRSVVGFEISNKNRKNVLLSTIIKSTVYSDFQGALPLILGAGTVGQNIVVDLARMPHLLIAGSTGSGKSVALNAILISLLCKCTPDDVQLILVDPKRLEFASYADIAHLLFPIVVDAHKVAPVLKWVVSEMERRYEQMAQCGTRNIFDYQRLRSKKKELQSMPFIVVVIDELSDLMMVAGKETEILITRIAQKARAAGIHMIIATQRPSVDVITGLIKVNFPSRISFRVTSKIDSRTILDCSGSEKLLGQGDMLFLNAGQAMPQRIHGAYVTDEEIEQVVHHIKAQRKVSYLSVHDVVAANEPVDDADDLLYGDIKKYLHEVNEISISHIQRYFRIGYNRSARIIEKLELEGAILPAQGGKMRKVVR